MLPGSRNGGVVDRIWLEHYPRGVPAEIDPSRYPSLVALLQPWAAAIRASYWPRAAASARYSLTWSLTVPGTFADAAPADSEAEPGLRRIGADSFGQ